MFIVGGLNRSSLVYEIQAPTSTEALKVHRTFSDGAFLLCTVQKQCRFVLMYKSLNSAIIACLWCKPYCLAPC